MKAPLHVILAATFGLLLAACAHTGGEPTIQPGSTAQQDRGVYLSLVSAIIDGGKPQAALAFLDDYLTRYPDDQRARLLKGDAYFKSGQMDAAGKIYQALLSKGSLPAAELGLGRVKAAQGDWSDAVTYLRLAYQHSPADPKILNDYGYALLKVADVGRAYGLLGRAYELRPNDQIIRNNFVLAAAKAGQEARVEAVLRKLDDADQARLKAFVGEWEWQSTTAVPQATPSVSEDKGP